MDEDNNDDSDIYVWFFPLSELGFTGLKDKQDSRLKSIIQRK